jgi:hypothetical protein
MIKTVEEYERLLNVSWMLMKVPENEMTKEQEQELENVVSLLEEYEKENFNLND